MNLDKLIERLAYNSQTIQRLVTGFSVEQARWKPDEDTWSVLEVVNHLYAEERGDFRTYLARAWNLASMQAGFDGQFPYDSNQPEQALEAFLEERAQSLKWLRELENPDWNVQCPLRNGEISTGMMMASWVAHDVLHMRQLVELEYAHTKQLTHPHDLSYAGDW